MPALDTVEREAIAKVQKLSSGEATPAEVEDIARWRAQSPAHEAAYVGAEQVWGTVSAAGRALHKPDTDFTAALDRLGQKKRKTTRRAILGGGAIAMATAAAYAATRPPFALWPSLSELRADYHTATGEQRSVMFAGDVTINLNTQTSLAIRPAANAEDRIELVAGEASFITARAERPLVVVAASGRTVTETGRFDIRYTSFGQEGPVSVTCFDGVLRVEHEASTAELRAGQMLRYDAAGLGKVVTIDPAVASNWQRGIVEFRGTPLSEAVEEINRYRPGRIIVMNAALGREPVSGRFRIDQMNNVLAQLESLFGAKLQRLPGGIVLMT